MRIGKNHPIGSFTRDTQYKYGDLRRLIFLRSCGPKYKIDKEYWPSPTNIGIAGHSGSVGRALFSWGRIEVCFFLMNSIGSMFHAATLSGHGVISDVSHCT